jgi:hypothetical protein
MFIGLYEIYPGLSNFTLNLFREKLLINTSAKTFDFVNNKYKKTNSFE